MRWTPELGSLWKLEQSRSELLAAHTGPGHSVAFDEYRAPCRPPGGCRQCGRAPQWPKRFYCSDECRDEFDQNHFWGSARHQTLWRRTIYDVGSLNPRRRVRYPVGTVCARCEGLHAAEVNHIVPVAGLRFHVDCAHHQANLEALCHPCHVEVTNEQRAAGLLRRPPVSLPSG